MDAEETLERSRISLKIFQHSASIFLSRSSKRGTSIYSNILETVGNTPVVRVNRLAPEGVNLYVKVEAFNPLGSVKDRLAPGSHRRRRTHRQAEARPDRGRGQPAETPASALPWSVRKKVIPCVLVMAETFSIERRKLMRFWERRSFLRRLPARATGMAAKAAELAKEHGWFLTRQFTNEANADFHSKTTAVEILEDFKDQQLDYWVTGFGTGGTLKGVARVSSQGEPEDEDRSLRAG